RSNGPPAGSTPVDRALPRGRRVRDGGAERRDTQLHTRRLLTVRIARAPTTSARPRMTMPARPQLLRAAAAWRPPAPELLPSGALSPLWRSGGSCILPRASPLHSTAATAIRRGRRETLERARELLQGCVVAGGVIPEAGMPGSHSLDLRAGDRRHLSLYD